MLFANISSTTGITATCCVLDARRAVTGVSSAGVFCEKDFVWCCDVVWIGETLIPKAKRVLPTENQAWHRLNTSSL